MSYRTIKGLKRNAEFAAVTEKLYKSTYLMNSQDSSTFTEEEEAFLLACALVLLKGFDSDKSYKSYAEFAYALILKYSLKTGNYHPLYDFSVNFGFYPISDLLISLELIELNSIKDELSKMYIDETYAYKDIIETHDQKKMRDSLVVDSDINEVCLVAPTSYGKSSLVIDDILDNRALLPKVAVIVPTKSLIAQTYSNVKSQLTREKIVLHDEMYMNDDSFVGILTQERAIRLLIKHSDLSFDKMYIDEAHNLFSNDHRVVMLARLIKMNRERNPQSRLTYLSPLISNSDNLRFSLDQDIVEQRIDFNMKEPILVNVSSGGEVSLYNRFLDTFYTLDDNQTDYIAYILNNSSSKSFIYLYSPVAIEEMCLELIGALPDIEDSEIDKIINNLSEHIHEDFFSVQCLRKGIVYLHGRLPDNVKEYLENKFSEVSTLRFMVANRVVLEGVNMPVQTLFIMNTYRLDNKDLTNLVGRVNRLNNIFLKQKQIDLLLPRIHFVNTDKYHRVGGNMINAIRTLRTGLAEDEVDNPLLIEFDIHKYHSERDKAKIESAQRVLDEEEVIESEAASSIQALKQSMIQLGLSNLYKLTDHVCETISNRLEDVSDLSESGIVETIYQIFVKDLEEHITDKEFQRMSNPGTRVYYQKLIDEYRALPFKQSINSVVATFVARIKNPDKSNIVYLGKNLGELTHPQGGYEKLYVDLGTKSRPQLVNIAIAKLKLEVDFINYKLAMILQLMLDKSAISTDIYNFVIHGTTDTGKLRLMRLGMSAGIINRLEGDEQLVNVTINSNNQIEVNESFRKYLEALDDFSKFEISKLI